MANFVRCGVTLIGLLVVAGGRAEDERATAPVSKAVGLFGAVGKDRPQRRHDGEEESDHVVGRDGQVQSTKQGKVVDRPAQDSGCDPLHQGYYVTASTPDLDMVQFPPTKFQVKLSQAEVMALSKEASWWSRARSAARSSPTLAPTSSSPAAALPSHRVRTRITGCAWITFPIGSKRMERPRRPLL